MAEFFSLVFFVAFFTFLAHLDSKSSKRMDESNDGWGSFDPSDGPDYGGF